MRKTLEFVAVGIIVLLSTWGLTGYLTNAAANGTILPLQASQEAVFIDYQFDWHWFLISFFFSLIVGFMLYSIVFHRQKGDDESDGDYFEGHSGLEVVWTIIPLGIVLALAIFGGTTLSQIERRATNALEVNVIGQRWAWRFEYPESGAVSSDLVLPVNRQVLLRMRSEDVIHSFWVPEFRVKQDLLPATFGDEENTRELRITPSVEGEYKVRCAELCGELHYAMLADVLVVSSGEFETWATAQAAECDLEAEECGARWVEQYGCTACHSFDGTQIVGPTWQGLAGSQVPLADGSSVLADEAYLQSSILDPNDQIHEGFQPNVMPVNFAEQLTEEQILEIIAFIQSLGE